MPKRCAQRFLPENAAVLGMSSGERFALVRTSLGLTQIDMARNIGVSRDSWRQYEAGDLPNGRILERVAHLGFDIHWLLTGEGEMKRDAPRESAGATPQRPIDRELMARIMDGLFVLYRDEKQRLVPLDQGRMAADLYDELIGIADEAERRGALRYALEQRRKELRRAALDPDSSKASA